MSVVAVDLIENWLPIPGYEGLYEVSDLGRVRSLDRIDSAGRRLRGQILRPTDHGATSSDGSSYQTLTLSQCGAHRKVSIHRLVARAFLGEPGEGDQVRHLNGVRDDNRLVNLAWGTGSENELDKLAHGRNLNAVKTHCPSGHEYAGENLFFNRRGGRFCRICSRIRSRAQRAARKADLNNEPTADAE